MTERHIYTSTDLETSNRMDYDRVLAIINKGAIEDELGLMRWGSNYTFLVNVSYDGSSLMAIYKPRDGERPLWDFPDGTLCQRERATYLTSEALGWDLIPPTALREGPRGMGSLQVFVPHDPEQHYFTLASDDKTPLRKMALLDAIINNADRKGGHCLLDEDGKIWGIDHGLTFHKQYKLRTVIWDFSGQDIDDGLLDDLLALCKKLNNPDDPYTLQMKELVSLSELNALERRIHTLTTIKVYPMPGPGPNRPWPPV